MVEHSPSPAGPAWVAKRDGRLVPFEPDKISRALFAATETLGRPDAFLARELTDGVLHFLAAEVDGTIPTTSQIAETVVKIVRELGQPALAQTFADFQRPAVPPALPVGSVSAARKAPLAVPFSPHDSFAAVLQTAARTYSLNAVFSRDLAAAHADGLITLTGLETPLHLAGGLLDPGRDSLPEALEQARRWVGGLLAIDGPEYHLAAQARGAGGGIADFLRELRTGLRLTGLRAVVNLNSSPPAWADPLAEGPLFAAHRRPEQPDTLAALALTVLEGLLTANENVRVDWHLGERDFEPGASGRLLRLARLALEAPALAFTFDRPRKPVALAEGIDRRHPAVLLAVGLHLPRLLEMQGLRGDPERFLQKLGSLTRLALSAAACKRDFLRRQAVGRGEITRGFLLDRARLVVTPVALEDVVRTVTGSAVCAARPALDLARRIVQRLREVLRQDGPGYQLDACLDGPRLFSLEEDAPGTQAPLRQVAGITPWDGTAPAKAQLRAAAALHGAADGGTAALHLPADASAAAEEVADWLRQARQTDVVRLRLVRAAAVERQLTAPWEEASRP